MNTREESRGSAAYQRAYYNSRLENGQNPYGVGAMQWELQKLRQGFVSQLVVEGDILLDIASGLGESSVAGAQNLAQVISLDVSREALSRAPDNANILKIEGLGEHLPLANNSVNVACLWEIIEHTDNPRLLLSEAHRVLKHDGIMLLSTPNAYCLNRHVKKLLVSWLQKENADNITARDDHFKEYCYFETIQMVSDAGFRIEDWHGYGLIFPFAWQLQQIPLLSPLIKLHVYSGEVMKTLAQETYIVARCEK